MLVVELDRALERLVADDVAMSEILGDDTRPRLVLLLDVIVSWTASGALSRVGGNRPRRGGDFIDRGRGAHLHLIVAELRVVEQQRRFGCSLFFKRDGRGLQSI